MNPNGDGEGKEWMRMEIEKATRKDRVVFYIREENSFADLKSVVNCGFVVGLISG